jgi:hypothetical protein
MGVRYGGFGIWPTASARHVLRVNKEPREPPPPWMLTASLARSAAQLLLRPGAREAFLGCHRYGRTSRQDSKRYRKYE